MFFGTKIHPRDLQTALVNWTVAHSGHEQARAYIGLSGIADCDQVIYDRYFEGSHAQVGQHLLTRVSYDLEAKLVERLGDIGIYQTGEEISLFDGVVQGHTDGRIGEAVLEIETIALERWLPQEGRLPNRIFMQVQAYMHYLKRDFCHVLYLARDTGIVQVNGIRRRPELGDVIEAKVSRLAVAVLEYQRLPCSCGKCGLQTPAK
ncbi:MAG: hypothetical protein EHM48_00700 [Planctomycetaceae bacterium]|nr:MAG: hypothetical protein EHM48_00700 [Planctomycetaceae bacterium]